MKSGSGNGKLIIQFTNKLDFESGFKANKYEVFRPILKMRKLKGMNPKHAVICTHYVSSPTQLRQADRKKGEFAFYKAMSIPD